MRQLFLFIAFFFAIVSLNAQTDSAKSSSRLPQRACDVKMDDGKEFSGIVVSENDSILVLATKKVGRISLRKSRITSSYYYFVKGPVTPDDPEILYAGASYNVISSNAFLFRKKSFDGSSNFFAAYHINYCFSENFSLGLSTSLFANPLMLHAKAHFKITPTAHFGFEGFLGTLTWGGRGSNGGGGFASGVGKLTLGNHVRNVTLYGGSGLGISNGNPASDGIFFYGIAGAYQATENGYIVAELWTAQRARGSLFLIGLRTNFKPRISWVFAVGGSVLNFNGKTQVTPFPYIGFSYRI